MVEMITGLHPFRARELVDDTLYEEMPALIRAVHDGTAKIANANKAANGAELATNLYPSSPKTRYPAELLQELSDLAAKCVRLQVTHRCTVSEVLQVLEELETRGLFE